MVVTGRVITPLVEVVAPVMLESSPVPAAKVITGGVVVENSWVTVPLGLVTAPATSHSLAVPATPVKVNVTGTTSPRAS